jgi:hypothetical protein
LGGLRGSACRSFGFGGIHRLHGGQNEMIEAIRAYLPWLLSAITIWMTLMAGNKHPQAWLIGLGNQALWLLWICVVGAWGLLPMNLALWIVYGRNHLKWSRA